MFQLHPVTDIHFEILDHDIQIYSAKINIIANLSGLRYLMFHWPISSAFIGIGSNLLFVFFIFSLSWRHIYGSEIFKNESNGKYIKNIKNNKTCFNCVFIFEDLMDQCEQLYDSDSEDESDTPDILYKESPYYRRLMFSQIVPPEQ